MIQTAERISGEEPSDRVIYRRSLKAYHYASNLVSGTVLEIGTGCGYGIDLISPKVQKLITIDKNRYRSPKSLPENVLCIQMSVPALYGIADHSVDFVISFQVIEHIEADFELLQEINRVLKIGGKLILSTPNKKMSLTRNPWHVREYTIQDLEQLLLRNFRELKKMGVYGNEKVMNYYHENRKSVQRISALDVFKLWNKLPRKSLQFLYDVLNRYNRKKLMKNPKIACSEINMNDYFISEARDHCFDLMYIAEKSA